MVDFIFAEDIQSSVNPEECSKLAELGRDKLVLELGSWFGRSTVALASVAQRVHSVDWHKGDSHAGNQNTLISFMKNLETHKCDGNVIVHVGRNDSVLPMLAPGAFDLAFIDSYHSYEAVEADIKLTLPLMKKGGVIAFHDYGLPGFGVTEAVDKQ